MRNFTLLFALFISLSSSVLFAQNKQITGTVTGADDGGPIPGATVVAKGFAGVGTITDFNGKFSLDVPANATVLVFSFVGMETQEVLINGRSVVDVVLKSGDVDIEEVVVMGYMTRTKSSITGSTVSVNQDAIKNIPVVSVEQTLQGKVAGLTVSSSSGTPGSVQDMRIRGVGSMSASNQPLYVVDGIPIVSGDFSGDGGARSTLSGLSTINSADIESITVLKDASSTSQYGARGSNGVIVITTKKGKAGKTKFELTSTMGFQNKAVAGPQMLNGAQTEELLIEAVYNKYGPNYALYGGQNWDAKETYEWVIDPNNWGAPGLEAWVKGGRVENDWDAALTNENAPTRDVNLSARGGDDNSNFYVSFGYNSAESVVVGPKFNRSNASLNYRRNLTKKIVLSTTNTVSNTNQTGIILEQSAYFGNPMMGKYFMSPFEAPYDSLGNPTLTATPYNHLYLKDANKDNNRLNRLSSNSYLEYEIISNLKFKSAFAIDYSLVKYHSFSNKDYGDSKGEGGTVYQSNSENTNIVTQNSLSYSYRNQGHDLNVLGLIEYQKNANNFLDASGQRIAAKGLTFVNEAPTNRDASASFTDWYNASYLMLGSYTYNGKYNVNLTYRREGSSRFAPGFRFGDFYGAGLSWDIAKESFMSSLSFIDNLRFRASYGISGNSAIAANQYATLLGYDADYNNQAAVYPVNFENQELTWEKNQNIDFGFDFGFLKNRINGSVAYFDKTTFDLLQDVNLSAATGHNSVALNVGKLKNKGIEAILNVDIIRTKDLTIGVNFNYASLNNEVMELAKFDDGSDIVMKTGTTKTEVGQSFRAWHMRKYAGVNPVNGKPLWYKNGKDGETTESYYTAAEEYQGLSAIPTYSGGAGINVNFKGIYFTANLAFQGGNKVYEDWSFYTHHAGYYPTELYHGDARLFNRWQKPGDITNVPVQVADGTGFNASRTSTRFLYDGDYMRLKDLVLGYELPSTLTSKIGFDKIGVFVRGTNQFTWVKDENLTYDPEVRADGFTRMTNPPVKSWAFGVNLNF